VLLMLMSLSLSSPQNPPLLIRSHCNEFLVRTQPTTKNPGETPTKPDGADRQCTSRRECQQAASSVSGGRPGKQVLPLGRLEAEGDVTEEE